MPLSWDRAPTILHKREEDTEQYFFVWDDTLASSECINTSTYTVDTGLTLGATSIITIEMLIEELDGSHTYTTPHQTTLVTLSGGTAGKTYGVTNQILTSRGRTLTRTRHICVVDAMPRPVRGGYPNRYQYR